MSGLVLKSEKYLDMARRNGKLCAVCVRNASEIHHENVSNINKYYKRHNDFATIPLCKHHHDLRHQVGAHTFWTDAISDKSLEELGGWLAIAAVYITTFLLTTLRNENLITIQDLFLAKDCLGKALHEKKIYEYMDELSKAAFEVVENGEEWNLDCRWLNGR